MPIFQENAKAVYQNYLQLMEPGYTYKDTCQLEAVTVAVQRPSLGYHRKRTKSVGQHIIPYF